MESNDKLKEIDIKNRMCFYFDDIIKIEDFHLDNMIKIEEFHLDNILIDEKSYENILVYNISDKGLIDSKPSHIRFDKINGFIRVYDETTCLVSFESEKYDFIYNRIIYPINVKSGIKYVISHNYVKIKVDSYDPLPLEKTMTFHNVIILKPVWNKNNYYYSIFLEIMNT